MVGDSFTFGHGVNDNETFPAQLEAASGIETVNLGLMGYGMDQAYLMYGRMAPKLDHQVLLFGMITDNFRRMMVDRLADGHFKPQLAWRDGKLAEIGVPVRPPLPQGNLLYPERRLQFIGDYFAVPRLLPFRRAPGEYSMLDRPEESEELAEHIFLDLDQRLRAQGRRLAIVWFPALYEFTQAPAREQFEFHFEAMKNFTAAHDIPLIDLTHSLPAKTEPEYQQSYLPYEFDEWRHPTAQSHAIFVQAALPQVRKLMDEPPPAKK